ncbi:MAG TPA: heavy-metal-associated domain-containing protein [Bacteroidales bacterium]|nr:heavy-metal-associated domain-containing protein [Bacteroidales bacterium]
MKTKMITTLVMMLIGVSIVFAGENKTEKFKVYGNCGMCEKRIENAVSGLDGVVSADWDKETEMIEVTYDPEKVKLEGIHKAIAKVGHDTDTVKAEDDVYNDLPGCCKYDRPEEKK